MYKLETVVTNEVGELFGYQFEFINRDSQLGLHLTNNLILHLCMSCSEKFGWFAPHIQYLISDNMCFYVISNTTFSHFVMFCYRV